MWGVKCGLHGHFVGFPMWQAPCSVLGVQNRTVPVGMGRSGRGGVEGGAVTGAGEGASPSPHSVASWTSRDVSLSLSGPIRVGWKARDWDRRERWLSDRTRSKRCCSQPQAHPRSPVPASHITLSTRLLGNIPLNRRSLGLKERKT